MCAKVGAGELAQYNDRIDALDVCDDNCRPDLVGLTQSGTTTADDANGADANAVSCVR